MTQQNKQQTNSPCINCPFLENEENEGIQPIMYCKLIRKYVSIYDTQDTCKNSTIKNL